jgi:chemotaxis signal transduction protein
MVAVPSSTPGLLGITELRGGILAVFSLAALLGYSAPGGPARWLAICGSGAQRVGLAFAEFEHCFEASLSDVSVIEKPESRGHSREVVRAGNTARPIVSIPSVLRAIKIRDQHKER